MIDIEIKYFMIGMFMTFSILYLYTMQYKIVLKEPSINDEESDIYMDDNKVCYKYKKVQISCHKI